MIYTESKSNIIISGSPSYLPNNLSVSSRDVVSFIRMSEVYLVHLSGESVKVPVSKSRIHQASFIKLQGSVTVLAILSNLGLHLWSANGESMLFFFPLSSLTSIISSDSLEESSPLLSAIHNETAYLKGVAGLNEHLCVGTSVGTILIFTTVKGGSDSIFSNHLHSSSSAISVMSSSSNILVAGNDEGRIYGYRADEGFEQSFEFTGGGFPCTCLYLADLVLIAAYSSGHIRIFRIDIMELTIEVAAHTRSISGLAYSLQSNQLATCSQDQYVHVWTLPDFKTIKSNDLVHECSIHLENKMCTGIGFLSDVRICIAIYDEDELIILDKVH